MVHPFFAPVLRLIFPTCCAVSSIASVPAQDAPSLTILKSLRSNLRVSTPEETQNARREANDALRHLQSSLSQQAYGVVLQRDLELDRLATEIERVPPAPMSLLDFHRSLRRTLPGSYQGSLDELRDRVARLARLTGVTSEAIAASDSDFGILQRHVEKGLPLVTPEEDFEIRHAFARIAAIHTDTQRIADMRQRISYPNSTTLVRRAFLEKVSRGFFEIPIDFRDFQDQTSLQARGLYRVEYSLEIPNSQNENHLLLRLDGNGRIDAMADRRRIHVRALLCPHIVGVQSVRIRPLEIVGDSPNVHADIELQLNSLRLDGHLGRIPVFERAISSALRKQLQRKTPVLERQIESAVRERAEEEGYKIAHRINSLLRHGVWERFQSLEFTPEIQLFNDDRGILSSASYMHADQLGALTAPPRIPPEIEVGLDTMHWFHESAVNNILESLRDLTLDEATVRGIWQVQLKLTRPEWQQPHSAVVPASIRFAHDDPIHIRWIEEGVEIFVNAVACEVDGKSLEGAPREMVIRYRVDRTQEGLRFQRVQLELPGAVSGQEQAIWSQALDRFFPEYLQPQARFRRSSFASLLALKYLKLGEGWLVLGLGNPESQAPSQVDRP